MAKKSVTKTKTTKKTTKAAPKKKAPVKARATQTVKSIKTLQKVKITKPAVVKKASQKKKSGVEKVFSYLRLGESYTSLVLGIIAVILGTTLLLSVFNSRQANRQTPEAVPTTVEQSGEFSISPTGVAIEAPEGIPAQPLNPAETTTEVKSGAKTYTVVEGDNLWTISEKVYGSGYNWVEIAQANKLSSPNDIHVGNVLQIPSARLKDATVYTIDDDQSSTTAKITEEKYTIKKGDDLWDIAVRAYGDGYQWVKIAQANNLTNPDLIHVDNTIKIPRN